MKAILEFDLDNAEDRESHALVLNADNLKFFIQDLYDEIRALRKRQSGELSIRMRRDSDGDLIFDRDNYTILLENILQYLVDSDINHLIQ
jgi:hypothetical protein